MTTLQQKVYDFMLQNHCGGVYSLGIDYISERTGMTMASIRCHIGKLKAKGLISLKNKGYGNSGSEYIVNQTPTVISQEPLVEPSPKGSGNSAIIDELLSPQDHVPVFSELKSRSLLFMQEICQMEDTISLLTAERNQYKSQLGEAMNKIHKIQEAVR